MTAGQGDGKHDSVRNPTVPLPEGTPEDCARAINTFRKAVFEVLREMIVGRQELELVFDEAEEGPWVGLEDAFVFGALIVGPIAERYQQELKERFLFPSLAVDRWIVLGRHAEAFLPYVGLGGYPGDGGDTPVLVGPGESSPTDGQRSMTECHDQVAPRHVVGLDMVGDGFGAGGLDPVAALPDV